MEHDFMDKVIVITGGSSGIGRALVECFKNKGAKVSTCGRNMQSLETLKKDPSYENLFIFQADVAIEEDCRKFIHATLHHYGRIDVLINNAGISMRALFHELETLDTLKKIMDTNFWGTVYCTKYALPALLKSKGTIVGISSIAGYRGLPGRTGYSASKFAMQGFLEALRTENLKTGIHVMWVSPNFTTSNIRNTALNKNGVPQGETPLEEGSLMSAEEVAEIIIKAIIRKKRNFVMTFMGKLTVFLNKIVPGLTDQLVFNHFKKEPGSPLS
ncbi:MAG: SDR family oxidoreductase [Chitinophagaceae bacterium]